MEQLSPNLYLPEVDTSNTDTVEDAPSKRRKRAKSSTVETDSPTEAPVAEPPKPAPGHSVEIRPLRRQVQVPKRGAKAATNVRP